VCVPMLRKCLSTVGQRLVNMGRCATMTAMRRRCCSKSWALYSPKITRTQVKPAAMLLVLMARDVEEAGERITHVPGRESR
jgi:hypothetical protein